MDDEENECSLIHSLQIACNVVEEYQAHDHDWCITLCK